MHRRIKHSPGIALLTGASLAVLSSAPVFAQDEEDFAEQDEIVVTGSRIVRPSLDAPSPVTSVDASNIQFSGEKDITSFLNELPALVGSNDRVQATNAGIGSTGLTTLNLRNLGSNRTLVLVNGRRHVGGSGGTAAVDVNTIPVDLIERVDVLTGGASAVYGADAVTGAVNFVLKDDFEGLSVSGQGGVSSRGDAESYFGSILAGRNFANGRGNVVVSYEYSKQETLRSTERSFSDEDWATLLDNPNFQPDPDQPGYDPYQRKFYKDSVISFASPQGAVAVDFLDGYNLIFDFEGDGDPYDPGDPISFRNAIGGSATPNSEFLGDLLFGSERHVANLNANYDVTDNLRGFFEFKFAQVESEAFGQPAFTDLIPIMVNENPFVPDAIAGAAAAAGSDMVFISHDTFELGRRSEDIRRRTYRIATGAEMGVTDNIDFEFSYVYGRTDEQFYAANNLVLDRFYAAMDAVVDPDTGQPTCRSNLDPSALPPQTPFAGSPGLGYFDAFNATVTPENYGTSPYFTPGPNSGCEPLNLFGSGNASQAAVDFVNDESLRDASIQQHVATAFFSGDLGNFFELPGGPVSFALGGEYRKEKSVDIPPLINTEGFTFGNEIFPTRGDFDVYEGFVEVSLPVIADRPFVELFNIDAAFRASDYSTVGYTQAWNVGGIYAPVNGLRFRGTYAKAVRAPNISELFDPQNQSFYLPDDPCDVDNIPIAADPGLRAANCAVILGELGVDPSTFEGDDILNATFPGVSGGNPDLQEERATTWTVGAVAQPGFIPGLSLTVDYFNITMRDGIISPASQDIVNQCVDLPSVENEFCDLISRRADGGLSFLEVVPVNVAYFETDGIDYEINYRWTPADHGLSDVGTINFRYIGSYLRNLNVVSLLGQDADEEAGETSTLLGNNAPIHMGALDVTWLFQDWTLNYRWRFRERMYRDEIDEFEAAINNGSILFEPDRSSRLSTHDVQIRYNVNDNADLYVGVNNMTDQLPDIGSVAVPVDGVGRYFYAGFNFRL